MDNYEKYNNIDMREKIERDYYDINTLLSKFDNGNELYNKNVVFRNCVENIIRGADIFKILEQVIIMHSDQQKRYEDIIIDGKIINRIIVSEETFKNLRL